MIVAYEVLQDEAGVYRLRVYDEHRFLFWTWTSYRWYGTDGCPGEGDLSLKSKISLGDDELRSTRTKLRLKLNPKSAMKVVHVSKVQDGT